MLQYTFEPLFVSRVPTKESPNSPNIVFLQNDNGSTTSTDVASNKSELNKKYAAKKDIYVCTFCQVFSPHFSTVSNHISLVHYESLPAGTMAENFVSRLQSLDENHQEKKGARGRPKKTQVESNVPEKSKQKIVNPVPDSEGLYWCKTCLRYFRKSRQLTQHICLGPEEQISSEESSVELDEDVEFRTSMDINPSPWSRIRKNRKLLQNSADQSNSNICLTEENQVVESKIIPNWRNDPRYIPLFDSEKEKAAFEEHLKSIDYSYVDSMYKIMEKQNKMKNDKNCSSSQTVIFSCNFCKKDCKSLSLIRAHCLIHTDIKPFTCPKCSYRTNSSGSLYSHMRMHTGNVYQCSFCDFTSMKRSHLLDHEATHSAVYQTCKLCKNQYKTLRSLIGHIRKYHNYPGGKKYMKSLTCKQSKFVCNICNKKFKTLNTLNNHNHACHEITYEENLSTEENPSDQGSENINNVITDIQINGVNNVEPPATDLHCSSISAKDPLAEMVLNDFLQQQQQSQSIMYQNVFSQASENMISSSNNALLSNFQAKAIAERLATESSILEECQKTLDLDILKECLQNSGFSNECNEFSLISNISRKHSLQNNSESNSDVANHLNEISEDKLVEPKSVEIKLFEKCQRAPAYVCCVCSSIYICPATLKAHLKEHVNSTISPFIDQAEEQQFENTPTKVTETNNELDVCDILQDSSESFSFDKEVEKLYTSSLDLMYYLPEVSVVLENDAALFDSVLDDISNFPINDNPSEDLDGKVEEENVLKMFS